MSLNLGKLYYQTGRFSKALLIWETTWNRTRELTDENAIAIANAAVAEYAVMLARIGRMQDLNTILTATASRVFQDSTLVLLERARDGLKEMINRPGISFRCGPYALDRLPKIISD